MVVKKSGGQTTFDLLNVGFMSLLIILTLYPCLYVLFASFSDPAEVAKANGILLFPQGFQLESYAVVFQNRMIPIGFKNTFLYVILGGSVNVIMTLFGAYALSRKGLYGRNACMLLIVFTMFFSGGLIPQFLIYKQLGFYNNMSAMIFPFAINAFNLIILRTFFQTIPDSMEESAKIDGANDFVILFRIMFPLALPAIAVVTLYYTVEHWNTYMRALIYISNKELYPLQVILREILIQNSSTGGGDSSIEVAENVKYATIVVATIPVLLVYPFLQRYFVKGIMIGAVKE